MTMLQDIKEYIRSGESRDQDLGLEIEHFIVDASGNQISFEEISNLIFEVGNRLGAEIHYMDGYPVGYYNSVFRFKRNSGSVSQIPQPVGADI